MATIEHRTTASGDPRYRVRWRHHGTQKVTTFATQHHAAKWIALLDAAGPDTALAALATPATPDTPTVEEWVAQHIDHLTGVQEGTRRDYHVMLRRHIAPHIGPLPLSLLTRQAGATWVNTLEQARLSGKTIRNVHSLLSAALTAAARDKIIGENPIKGLRLPATVIDAEMTFLTSEEFANLLALAPDRWRPLIRLLGETGLRWGEATALTVADLDFHRRTIRVRQAWKRTGRSVPTMGTTKGRQARTIAMPRRCFDELHDRAAGAAPGEYVFTNSHGGPVRHGPFRANVWAPLVARFAGDQATGKDPKSRRLTWDGNGVGKRPRIHDLRHSFASWAIAAGLSLTAIQRHIGHQSIQTTSDTYGHVFRADLAAFAQIIPEALVPSIGPGATQGH